MSVDELRTALANFRKQAEAKERARTDLHQAIADAARTGTPQIQIVRATGYTREHIRKICRVAGVDVLALPPQPGKTGRYINPSEES